MRDRMTEMTEHTLKQSHTHKCFFSSYLVVIEVTVDGKSVPSDSPLVARRPSPAPSQYASITFGSKKLSGDVTRLCQEKTQDEDGKKKSEFHMCLLENKMYLLLLHGHVLCRCSIGPLGALLPSEVGFEESVSDPPD